MVTGNELTKLDEKWSNRQFSDKNIDGTSASLSKNLLILSEVKVKKQEDILFVNSGVFSSERKTENQPLLFLTSDMVIRTKEFG